MNLNLPSFGTDPLLFVFLVLVGFFVVRELLTWYWKTNRIVSLLEQIDENTRKDIPIVSKKTTEAPTHNGPLAK